MNKLSLSLMAVLLPISLAACAADNDGPPPGGPHGHDPKMEAAMQACAAEQGASAPTPGQRPDGNKLDMQKFDACMTAKGFAKPQGGPHGGDGAPPQGGQPPAGNG